MASRLDTARKRITQSFDALPQKVFTRDQLGHVLADNRADWDLPRSLSTTRFIDFLIAKGKLRDAEIQAPGYATTKHRYLWSEASPFELGLSLIGRSYLSHGTAVFLHALTNQIPRTIYVNREQSPKPRGTSLTQASLDRAYTARQRKSNYIFQHDDYSFVCLSGMYSNDLEVSNSLGPTGEPIRLTNVERTLVDITVRPTYAGGVHAVLDAFRGARDRASMGTIIAVLRKLNYVYPYHQAVGFYAERAGYSPDQLERIKKLGLNYDFYLAHEMPETTFNATWKIHVPRDL